jgi:hypothetical protein
MPSEGKEQESESKEREPASDSELINSVKSFFYENDDFAEIFEVFAEENCDTIDLDEAENKLEYTELHEEFVALFEKQLEGFIEQQGRTVMEFFRILKESQEKDFDSDESIFGQIMLATCDFDVFMVMMQETKRRKDKRASRK